MKIQKYVSVTIKVLSKTFEAMSGLKVERVGVELAQQDEPPFTLSIAIQYESCEDSSACGTFLMGFQDRDTPLHVASSVLEHMGLAKPETLDKSAEDALGEYLNVVIGRTITEWDSMGTPVRFGPPSGLQSGYDLEKGDLETYKISLYLKDFNLTFYVTFCSKLAAGLEDKKRIMVVDDSALTRQILVNALTKAGFDTREVEDGELAVEEYKKYAPHLTLMDLVMPNMGGLDSMLAIRETAPDARFIVLTSSQRKDEVVSAKTIGVSDYLIKPVMPGSLIEAVQKAFQTTCGPPLT